MKNKILAYGELMMRLSPISLENDNRENLYSSFFGGSESNVLVTLSNLKDKTEYFTKFPNNSLGKKALQHLKKHKIGCNHIILDGDILGIYFTENNKNAKHAKVVYNRKNAVINTLSLNEFNMDELFKDITWFHVSGISLGISENSKNIVIELLKYAKKHNIKTSFDFNYRPALWSIEESIKAYKEAMPYIDVCFGNTFDLKTFLLINESSPLQTIKTFFDTYNVSYLIFTNRTINSKSQNTLNAEAFYKKEDTIKNIKTESISFEVLDRIGGGDAFDGGVIHELNKNFTNIKEAIELGLKLDVIKHSIPGDVLDLKNEEIMKKVKNLG